VCHLGVDLLSVSHRDPSCEAESKSVTYLRLNIAFFRQILPRVDWLDEYRSDREPHRVVSACGIAY
jgi:hypothetical protein